MAAGKRRRKSRGSAAAWICAYALMALVCALFYYSGTQNLDNEITFERSPLVLKKVTVINRQDQQQWYAEDMESGDVLYEMRVEYQNIADYNGELWEQPSVFDDGTGRNLELFEMNNSDLREWRQMIPAGKTGTVSLMFAAGVDTGQIRLEEREHKLSGERKSVTLTLPGEAGESVTQTAE